MNFDPTSRYILVIAVTQSTWMKVFFMVIYLTENGYVHVDNKTFQTSNGISSSNTGTPGSEGQSNMQGSYSFLLPDGTLAEVSFVADENGFQPSSDLLPVAPPLPDHVHELLRIAEEQRASGVQF
ncbi:cuticle protein AM1159-like [Penaeus chinensis]|uniref:cuticle protein AM1159-like n=1 Tax=Penaeus chinensis TaxID=139456 RepID=UPI001FB6C8B4|nr:cuticle protein AM1159-like [Penaeus chinensis]